MDAMLQAVIGLLIFVGILVAVGWVYKKLAISSKLSIKNSKYIRSLDRLMVSNDKWIEIVQVGDETILIGVTNNNITKITNINRENLNELQEESGKVEFAKLFNKYYNKKTD